MSLDELFPSAKGEDCKRGTVLSGQREAEVIVICKDDKGRWTMLGIFAHKAFFLTRRISLLSSGSLRRKLAALLLEHRRPDGMVTHYIDAPR